MKLSSQTAIVLKFIVATFIALSLSRAYLLVEYFSRIESTEDVFWIILQGVRVDGVVLGYFYLIPLLISFWLPPSGRLSQPLRTLLYVWLGASFTAIVFMEVVTPEFILEYDIRPNRIFIDYLAYPGEVSSMLWEGYKPAIFLALTAIAVCIALARFMIRRNRVNWKRGGFWATLGITLVVLVAGFLTVRSSLQHRPFNPSMVYFGNDNLLNSLPLNSVYSVLFAAYNAGSEQQASDFYGKLPEQEIITSVQSLASANLKDFVTPSVPTLRYHAASYQGEPRNVVILLQESLGSQFVGHLGGQDLTPNLDKLMQEGWLFSNAYATGTRSVRGIEAVFTGFTPGPSRAVVKLNKSQTNFFSIASLFKRHGYTTQFIYGGESHFDNMKSFFLGNGIDDIHDFPTFDSPRFVGSWGASDEDLYDEAHKEFERLNKGGQPFFSLVFTVSNHSPWEFPTSCNENFEGPRQTRENAIRYTDCALGKFIARAKQSDYWKNTIFLVIADHDSRVYGNELVPLAHFRIPALIFGADIQPRDDARLVSQIDMPPTLLSLAGISDYHPMIGYDLTLPVPKERERAMMQYGENFALIDTTNATVLRPNLAPETFAHDGFHLTPATQSDSLASDTERALSLVLWSSLAYERSYYRLPKETPPLERQVQR